MKSELSIRPLFHQLEPRVKAHVMVAFPGYALWVTLKHRLRAKPPVTPNEAGNSKETYSPMTALSLLSTLQSADIVLPTTDDQEIRLRRITEPTPEQKQLLDRLGIDLPQQFQSNQKCSVDLRTA